MFSELSKKILLISTLLMISGCSSLSLFKNDPPAPIPVEIRTVEVPIPIVHPTMPRAIDLKDPQWYVVSDKNLEEFDQTWVAYEQIYVLELMLIEADARRFITEAIDTVRDLTAIESLLSLTETL